LEEVKQQFKIRRKTRTGKERIIASFIMASSVIAMPNRLEKDENSHLLQTFEA
jgi:hypothetical protein